MPHALSPSCSSMCRRSVSARETAARRPLALPPTNTRAPIPSERISTSPKRDPIPEIRVTGSPARRISACASVRAWKPPWLGVFATTAFPPGPAPARRGPARSSGSSSWRCSRRGPGAVGAADRRGSGAGARSAPGTNGPRRCSDRHRQQASRQGLPISQTSRRASRSWCSLSSVDRGRDPRTALVEIDLRPGVVLAAGELDGRNRLVVVDQRRAGDRGAVDGVDVVPGNADPAPLAAGQVPQAVRVERLGRRLRAAPVRLPPRGSRLQLQGHGDTSSQCDLGLECPAFDHKGPSEIVLPETMETET